MTSPAPAGNTDAPSATVPWGKSEYASYLLAIASLLNGYFGNDYGLSKNAQAFSLLAGAVIVLGQNIARAIKHHAAMHANAAVYIAQLSHAAGAVENGVSIRSVTAGVAALNSAVVEDTAPAPALAPAGRKAPTKS